MGLLGLTLALIGLYDRLFREQADAGDWDSHGHRRDERRRRENGTPERSRPGHGWNRRG
ncbi:hypothetical protein SBA4_1240011 [Candidatus Sulfopaludibacter sp. SbA4]|nr:hypothetical protein SBA4_1240011 [Candidatus Sulfopaludibacter sp. SbA4]